MSCAMFTCYDVHMAVQCSHDSIIFTCYGNVQWQLTVHSQVAAWSTNNIWSNNLSLGDMDMDHCLRTLSAFFYNCLFCSPNCTALQHTVVCTRINKASTAAKQLPPWYIIILPTLVFWSAGKYTDALFSLENGNFSCRAWHQTFNAPRWSKFWLHCT